MRKLLSFLLVMLFMLSVCGCAGSNNTDSTTTEQSGNLDSGGTNVERSIIITVGDKEFPAELNDSKAAQELYDLLPLTVEMTELHGNEKYYVLPDKSF